MQSFINLSVSEQSKNKLHVQARVGQEGGTKCWRVGRLLNQKNFTKDKIIFLPLNQ